MPRVVRCACGQVVGVDESALGSEGSCNWCGGTLRVSPENSKAVPALGLTTPRMEMHVVPDVWESMGADACARCGQAFKGDWDRTRTDAGMFCHRCANLWQPPKHAEPKFIPSPPVHETAQLLNPEPMVAMQAPGMVDAYDDGFRSRTQKKKAAAKGEIWERHKDKFWFFVLATTVVTVVAFMPLGEFFAFIYTNEAAQSGVPLSAGSSALLIAVRLLTPVAIVFVPVYAGLAATDCLPNETVKNNVIAVGVVAAALSLTFLLSIFFPFYRALAIITNLAIVSHIYDIDTRGFVKFALIYLLLTPLMMLLASLVEGGTYGLLAGLSQ